MEGRTHVVQQNVCDYISTKHLDLVMSINFMPEMEGAFVNFLSRHCTLLRCVTRVSHCPLPLRFAFCSSARLHLGTCHCVLALHFPPTTISSSLVDTPPSR